MKNFSLFHITHIGNLSNILDCGVPCGPGGVLHDYVPFFFSPRPPMLFAIWRGYVESFQGEQNEIIHLEIEIADVIREGLPFVFTDGHAIMDFSTYYEDPEKIDEVIDWEVMSARYWRDTLEDGDRKRRRQAEFLIQKEVPFSMIKKITTMTRERMEQVQLIINKYDIDVLVELKPEWYY